MAHFELYIRDGEGGWKIFDTHTNHMDSVEMKRIKERERTYRPELTLNYRYRTIYNCDEARLRGRAEQKEGGYASIVHC